MPIDRAHIASALDGTPEKTAITFDDVKERVRALKMRGYDDVRTLRTLEMEGIDSEMLREALGDLAREERVSQTTAWKRAGVIGGALVAVGFVLDTWLGTSRAVGAFLVIVVVALMAVGIAWLVGLVREGQ